MSNSKAANTRNLRYRGRLFWIGKEVGTMSKNYIDERGWKYVVMPGLGENTFKARVQKAEKHGGVGWKCVAALPWRRTREEAQADLDRLAEKKGWAEWSGWY